MKYKYSRTFIANLLTDKKVKRAEIFAKLLVTKPEKEARWTGVYSTVYKHKTIPCFTCEYSPLDKMKNGEKL